MLSRSFFIPFLFASTFLWSNSFPNADISQNIKFTENKGQVYDQFNTPRTDVLFSGISDGIVFHLKNKGLSYQIDRPDEWKEIQNPTTKEIEKIPTRSTIYRIDITWPGINPKVTIRSGRAFDGFTNYYSGVCPKGVHEVRSFTEVTYVDLYDGIDLRYYENKGTLKYDYLLQAGADHTKIEMVIAGASAIEINSKGALIIKTPLGDIIDEKPIVFQGETTLEANWKLSGNVVGFEIAGIDPSKPLTIDPGVRLWGTYYGGNKIDRCGPPIVDAQGNIYFPGYTYSSNVTLATSGTYQNSFGGSTDGFLVKFGPTGNRIWGTYYGDVGVDAFHNCVLDANNNIFAIGGTASSTNIASPGAYQTVDGGGGYWDVLLVKFNNNGVRQWGTYYGGAGDDYGTDCTTDASGNVYISGFSDCLSGSVMSSAGSHQPVGGFGYRDGIIAKFSSSGARLWSTYYGGNGDDYISTVTIDNAGNIYVVGYSDSNSTGTIIATPGTSQPINAGSADAFFAKFNSNGVRQWGTYFGGPFYDSFTDVCLDQMQNFYMSGYTSSTVNIATAGAFQSTYAGGGYDACLVKFTNSGQLLWSTYYGESGQDYGSNCFVDQNNNAFLTGINIRTSTVAALYTSDGFQTIPGSSQDGMIAKFSPTGARLYASYYGGSNNDTFQGGCADANGVVYVTGCTASNNGTCIATLGSYQPNYGAGSNWDDDAFLVKFDLSNLISAANKAEISEAAFSLFPNPTKDIIVFQGKNEVTAISIFDFSGKLVLEEKLTTSRVDISSLSNGLYFVKVFGKEQTQTFKIVKN